MLSLFLLWISFNGRLAWDVVIVGAVVCLFVGVLLKFAVNYSPKTEIMVIARIPEIIRYIKQVLIEIVKANIAVSKLILSPYLRLQGQLVFFTPDLKTNNVRALLANSITITPGTITVQLRDGRFCVHTIRDEFVEDIENSVMVEKARSLEAKFLK